MKSRSNNRLQTSDPPDDWVNGSWTVDCICGVTFDDGEEMVNCDECGVWVHTRCFRFAKGEKSFACDKCKSKSSNSNRFNNESEETEVAQLLVELPTKTIKMSSNSNSNSNNNSNYGSYCYGNGNGNSNVFVYGNGSQNSSKRPPYRLWAKPMEERVHVQGVPGIGDDLNLFKGFSIPFASELWKCSGYVPKKFNFRYKEFPCWDEDNVGGENGVVCSLSKENNVVVSVKGGQSRKGLKERKSSEGGDLKKEKGIVNSTKKEKEKEKGMCRTIVVKRSREELGSLKDQSGKKKMKSSGREQDSKKDKGHGFRTVVVQSISARQVEVGESKAHKVASNAHLAEGSNVEKTKTKAATDEGNLVPKSPQASGPVGSSEKKVKAENPVNDAIDSSQKSALTDVVPLLNMEDGVSKNPVKKEGVVLETTDNSQGPIPEVKASDASKSKALMVDVDVTTIECNDVEVVRDVETTIPIASKTKSDTNVDNPKGGIKTLSDINVELDSVGMKIITERSSLPDLDSVGPKSNETFATNSHDSQDDGKTLEENSQLVKDEKFTENQFNNNKVKCEGSENSVDIQRDLDSKEAPKVGVQSPKLSGEREKLPPPSQSTIVNSRPSLSEKNKGGSSQYPSSNSKRVLSNSSMVTKKEIVGRVQVKDEDKYEKPKSSVKDHLKSSSTSMKISQSSKSVTSPVLKHHSSHGRDYLRHPFSKKSSVELSSGNNEASGSQPAQQESNGQSKSQHRGEKASQSNLQSTSKSAQFCHPPPSSSAPAGLSDEELALLLHQELNSSPRVPRVPRVRHTGSLPQLSGSATSILIKRTTSSGGKEHQTFSRRKNKDGLRRSREQDSEVRKCDRAPSSPDSVKTSDAVTQAEGPSESVHSVRKNVEDISTTAHSGLSSTDANDLKSSNHNPEDDTGTNNGPPPPVHRTLPGLIAEIMGEGRRMTYEELCNAVLPHWKNLRKHNGERYAYSSHSQAVLDCLRNRSEWAQLVDRGPKTNPRKKRKNDVDPSNTESEDGEYRTRRAGKSKSLESDKDEFPKGRRKAQKRRRLALRGRGVRDERRRSKSKVEVRSEESASFSESSDDSGSSQDYSQESGMGVAKSEVSASSADTAVAGR